MSSVSLYIIRLLRVLLDIYGHMVSVRCSGAFGYIVRPVKRNVSLPFYVSLKIHPDVGTSKFWVFVFFIGYAALCPGTMYSKTRLRSRRPRRGESSAATFPSWGVTHMVVSVYTVVCVRTLVMMSAWSSSCLLFRLMDHLPHSVQRLSTRGDSTGKIDLCVMGVPTTTLSN